MTAGFAIKKYGRDWPWVNERYRFWSWPLLAQLTIPIRWIRGHIHWWMIPQSTKDYVYSLEGREYLGTSGLLFYGETLEESLRVMRRENIFNAVSHVMFDKRCYDRTKASVDNNGGVGIYWPLGGSYMGVASFHFEPADETFATIKEDGLAYVTHFYDTPPSLWRWKMNMRYDWSGEGSEGICTRAQMEEYNKRSREIDDAFNRL
jgi:hypothetical protein